MKQKQKLELTWIGKETRPKLEPRILLQDTEKSYHAPHRVKGGDIFDNRLIFGDNLLALKALEQEYAGKVKCVYIDPPFNTGGAFEYYDDGLEHSIWLDLMAKRFEILKNLISDDGAIVVNLDDSEMAYCKIILDELFGRQNYITTIVVEAATGSSFKAVNVGPLDVAQYLLFYAKDKRVFNYQQQYIIKEKVDLQHFSRFIVNFEDDCDKWIFKNINEYIFESLGYLEGTIQGRWNKVKADLGESAKDIIEKSATDFAIQNSHRVFETKTLQKPSPYLKKFIGRSTEVDVPVLVKREAYQDLYLYKGRQIYFLKNSVKEVDGIKGTSLPLSTIWNDIPTNNLQNEGSVHFPSGKKPEALIRRVLSVTSKPGDLVLDSFAGSGTTGAVAHKMGRRWIMVELGEHCHTHIIPRLQKVIDGTDQGGISKVVEWKGGGGFRYYKLAPSLMEQDKWGNWVICKDYNAAMLAEAICKLEGFVYAPSDSLYWLHGHSTETDFIYVTTQNLSHEQLQALSDEVGLNRSLLVCCSAFRGRPDTFSNLTVKKIPNAVLSRCEWGHDDYSLKIENLPQKPPEPGQQALFTEEVEQ
jgi:adenine-specific DNA-methyltransferase